MPPLFIPPSSNTPVFDSVSSRVRLQREKEVRYIRPNGSDSNDGMTPSTAWSTLERGLEWFNSLSEGQIQQLDITGCHFQYNRQLVLGGAKVGGTDPSLDFSATGPRNDYLMFAYQIFSDLSASSGPLTLSSPTSDATTGLKTVTVSGQSWTVDQWKGYMLCGSELGECAVVHANTTNTLSVSNATSPTTFTAPIRLYGPGASITAGDPDDFFSNAIILMNRSDWVISGVRLGSTNNSKTTALHVINLGALLEVQLCDIRGVAIYGPAGYTGGANFDWTYIHDGTFAVNSFSTPQVRQSVLFNTNNISHEGTVQLIECVVDKNTGPFGGGNVTISQHAFAADKTWFKNSTNDAIRVNFGANKLVNCLFTGITGSAVVVDKGAWMLLNNCSGSNNTKFGLIVQNGSQCQVHGTRTITGSLGGMLVGGTTASFVISSLPVSDSTHFSRVYR